MSDPERPNPETPSFEVPDLEVEPVPRSFRQPPTARGAASSTSSPVAVTPRTAADPGFAPSFDFGDDLGDFELERSLTTQLEPVPPSPAPSPSLQAACAVLPGHPPNIPSGVAPDTARLVFDPRELAILADYGAAPDHATLAIAYAYRVFMRQRELKHQLIPIRAECQRAAQEREAILAELAGAVRPAIEQIPEFRRFLAPLGEVEKRAAARGQALSSVNAELGARTAALEAELSRLTSQLEAEQRTLREAQQRHDEAEANAKRADAKLKRILIEMRAVSQVAEQKRAGEARPISDRDAAELNELQRRAEASQPEVENARTLWEQEKRALLAARARLEAARRGQREIERKRQALGGAFRKELTAHAEGVSEAEIEQRAALAELGRAVLAAHDRIAIPEEWLERVRKVSDQADKLLIRQEMYTRAIAGYDVERARQGVRLAATALGLLALLFVFKLIF